MSTDGYRDHPDADKDCRICRGGGLLDDGDNYGLCLVPCLCTGKCPPDVVAKLATWHPDAVAYLERKTVEELDPGDFAVLLRIANDPEATRGRLKIDPKRVPLREDRDGE